jgi:hypothetical protein
MNVPWMTEIAGPHFDLMVGPAYRMLEDGATYATETKVQILGVSLRMEKDVCALEVRIAVPCDSWKEVITVGVVSPRSDQGESLDEQRALEEEFEAWMNGQAPLSGDVTPAMRVDEE